MMSRVNQVVRGSFKLAGLLMVLTACAGTAAAVDLPAVPEIDPGSMTSAVTLLVGGLLLLGDRLRRN